MYQLESRFARKNIGLTLGVGAFCVSDELNTVLASRHSQRWLPSQRAAPVEKRGTKDAGQFHPQSLALIRPGAGAGKFFLTANQDL